MIWKTRLLLQLLFIVIDRLSIYPWRAVAPHVVEGFAHPLYIQIMVQRPQPFLRVLASYLRYPSLFRAHVLGSLPLLGGATNNGPYGSFIVRED